LFAQDITFLLRNFHKEEHSVAFYADKMNLSVKALSKKVKQKMNLSLGQLIRSEIIHSAKQMLLEKQHIKEVAMELGFEEAHHFTSFFSHYVGVPPSKFKT